MKWTLDTSIEIGSVIDDSDDCLIELCLTADAWIEGPFFDRREGQYMSPGSSGWEDPVVTWRGAQPAGKNRRAFQWDVELPWDAFPAGLQREMTDALDRAFEEGPPEDDRW